MWFSPGMAVSALLILIMYEVHGSVGYWWVWALAVLISVLVDVALKIRRREVPRFKTRSEYTRTKE